MEDISLRARVQRMVRTGEIPCEDGKVWAGRGVGTHCAVCGLPIAPTEIEFEVALESGGTLRLHRGCHEVWRDECAALTDAAG
ncbi:MAG TPA: hypothetical protein VFL90_15925 [Methylomirabilota bacterium]|nr:hypothetical protein [Methylomirabilota bacterium]